jgi:hypothetical protein
MPRYMIAARNILTNMRSNGISVIRRERWRVTAIVNAAIKKNGSMSFKAWHQLKPISRLTKKCHTRVHEMTIMNLMDRLIEIVQS